MSSLAPKQFDTHAIPGSQMHWSALAALAHEQVQAAETRYPHLRFSVLFAEYDGLVMEKTPKVSNVRKIPPFPATFAGPSFVVSATNGFSNVESAKNSASLEDLKSAFQDVLALAPQLPNTHTAFADGDPIQGDWKQDTEKPLHSVPLNEKVSLLESLYEQGRSHAPGAQYVMARITERCRTEMFVSRAKMLRQHLTSVSAMVFATPTNDKGQTLEVYKIGTFGGGYSELSIDNAFWDDFDLQVKHLNTRQPLVPGEYDIILDPAWAGMVAHEAFGHGAEGDMITKNRSKAVHYLGKRVGSDLVSMVDSAVDNKRYGGFFFDHEGNLATNTVIIDKGILVRPMTHNASAQALQLSPSSNGRRQNPLHKTYTRMTNTDFLPGTHSLTEMIADVKYGFMLRCTSNGMEDPKAWGIQCQGALALEIRDGKLTGQAFGPVCLTGYVPDILGNVRMTSTSVHTGPGHCGKGHKEWVAVTDGGPHMLTRARLS